MMVMKRLFGSKPRESLPKAQDGQVDQDVSPEDQLRREEEEEEEAASVLANPESPQGSPRPQTKTILTDRQKWERSMARWRPDIQPGDEAFQTRLAAFQTALQRDKKSVNAVITAHFSSHEVQKFIHGYVSRTRLPAIYAAQRSQARRFRALMVAAPWNDRRHRQESLSPLAWKLTLLYFGLPVSPMRLEDALGMTENIFPRAGVLGSFRKLDDVEDEKDEQEEVGNKDNEDNEDMSFLPNSLRPLRFLNHYERRGFGKDISHVTAEKTYELYYNYPMTVRNSKIPTHFITSLRGGGGDSYFDDDDAPVTGDEIIVHEPSSLSLRGGSGGSSSAGGEEAMLWGLSGGTYFSLSDHISFFAAVNRLIGISKVTGDTGITLSLLSHPEGQRTPCTVVAVLQCFLGRSEETELNSFKEWMDTVRYHEESAERGEELSMCVSQLSEDFHFSDKQEVLSYKPSEDASVASFSLPLPREGPHSVAYLEMSDRHLGTPANRYQMWFKSIWRTLSSEYETKPCILQISGAGSDQLPSTWFHSCVGASREAWEWFVNEYYQNGQREFFVHAMDATPWMWHVPGYDTCSHLKQSSLEIILKNFSDAIPKHELEEVRDFLIRPFNFHGFVGREGEVVVTFEGQVVDFRSKAATSQWGPKLQEWQDKGYSMHVLPRWNEYEMVIKDDSFKFGNTSNWATVLEIAQALNDVTASDTDVLIEQRHDDDGAKGKNKVCWQFEAKNSPEMKTSWRKFLDNLTTRHVSLSFIPKLNEKHEAKSYWGSHDHNLDMIAFMEQATHPAVSSTSRVPFGLPPSGSADPSYPPRCDLLNFDSTGYPVLGAQLDDSAKSKALREWAYARPLSLHMENQYPSIPIIAPPLETILKTPSFNGLPSDSVPIMSSAVMTPTEQHQMQETLFQLRTVALNRAQPCPYAGCTAYFPVDEAGMVAFRTHLTERHTSKNCPFCTERLFAHWSPGQIKDHFLTHHADYFSRRNDLARDLRVKISPEQRTHRREEAWNFCARCGRNHCILAVKADRAQHDSLCYVGGKNDGLRNKYCTTCGLKIAQTMRAHAGHECLATADKSASNAYCEGCAFPCHKFSPVYAQKHIAHCKGLNCGAAADWCVWCGRQLQYLAHAEVLDHLDNCLSKPAYAEGPLDPATGQPHGAWQNNDEFFFRTAETSSVAVPERCRVSECRENLRSLGSGRAIFRHFIEKHKDEFPKLIECPLCQLHFADRGWSNAYEKTNHFDDHVHVHTLHIIADLEIARERRFNPTSRRIVEVENIRGLYEDLKTAEKRNAELTRELEGLMGGASVGGHKAYAGTGLESSESPPNTRWEGGSDTGEKRPANDDTSVEITKRPRIFLRDLGPDGESSTDVSSAKLPILDDAAEMMLEESQSRAGTTIDDLEELDL